MIGKERAEGYRRDIDGLRAVAVLAVVVHHLAPEALTGGFVGVDIFFVISGFLITQIIRGEIERGQFSFVRFYERRARRIFPALFVVLAVTVIAAHALFLPRDLISTLGAAAGTILFASNFVFWRSMADGYFAATDSMLNPLLHTWSLGVEEQYYLLFPVALLVLHRWTPSKVRLYLILATLASLALAQALVATKSVAVFFLSPFRAWELLAGSILAYEVIPTLRSRHARELLSVTGAALILFACIFYTPKTTFPGLTALAPVLGTAAIIYAGMGGTTVVNRFIGVQPFVFVGLISYSLYLWHWPLIVLTKYTLGMPSLAPYVPHLLLASLVLASLSYWFVETPFRRKSAVSRTAIFVASSVCTVAVGVVVTAGILKSGYESRFSEEVLALDKARAPQVPFLECDSRRVEVACVLGNGARPTMLFWGDSHLLAWAPVVDKVLRESGNSAVMAQVSACPPFTRAGYMAANPICQERTDQLLQYLQAHPEIETVVLAAYWDTYFSGRDSGDKLAKRAGVATRALADTLDWLKQNKKKVIVLGPVPVYDASVPLVLALERHWSTTFMRTTADEQHARHRVFFDAVARDSVQLGDPIHWLCSASCLNYAQGRALYRDAHHLSTAGALYLEPHIRTLLQPGAAVRISP